MSRIPPEERTALIVGAGPAGLAAAEVLSERYKDVLVCDAMPSPARKFLMAGKSGLNLTNVADAERMIRLCGADLAPMVRAFDSQAVCRWAERLGQPLFTGSGGRVFPVAMKASPLLRAWLARLEGRGVTLRRRWRWAGISDQEQIFETPEGRRTVASSVTILAMGGASWSRLGSDGAWVAPLGLDVAPFQPANVGLRLTWSAKMARHFGQPIKTVTWAAGGQLSRGEGIVSSRGIEGGGIYPLSPHLRDGERLDVDLKPDWDATRVSAALVRRGKASWSQVLRKRLRLDPVKAALLREFGGPPEGWTAQSVKALHVPHEGPHPIDEAISVAGGVRFSDLDANLMIRIRPGVFCAGEMLDWEAPTGGYLLTGCLATGRWAGQGALQWLDRAAP
ncbi:TIGR03862 family flavoprotein [Aestuariibius sp. 2305UL40-4]|uniref:TIGR03862 family flavoprotein n=1 Tax=Aestuariibius violaceus TaxID=3234132 RepID=UPI00345E2800